MRQREVLQLPEERLFFEELPKTHKKLVLVLAISVLVTDSGEKIVRMPCIYYSVQFQEDQEQVRALFISGSKINAINSDFAQKLGVKIRKINVET